MTVGSPCLLLAVILLMVCSGLEERLVLHSDTDIALEISQMKALLVSQNQSIQTLTLQLTNLTRAKDAEIAQLKSNLTTQSHEISQLKTRLHAKELAIQSNLKSTYVRWGKTTCPGNGSSMVYSGYMAGGQFAETGSGSNYLCLVDKPHWNYYVDGQGYGGVRGIQYDFNTHTASDISKFFGSNIQNDDAPCAVCETNRAANIMIPGTDVCYGGWTKEYSGYLVSGWPGHAHQYEFVCLDDRADTIPGSQVVDTNAWLYISEVNCGSSSLCPPYVENRELTCVVCSI